jgi:phenylalanyl-tRNA synthetase beta chain
MIISLNWLNDYIDIHLEPEKIGEILTELGLELEGMEVSESIKGGLQGVLTGLVTDCQKHPNADKLSLTKVDVGSGQRLSIVCGAPNVATGQKVLVATVGTTLYPTGSDTPLLIKKAKVRGEDSEGMICAADELGMGTDHSGILVLPIDTPIGLPASTYFNLQQDISFEIGLTPNRSDATNHIGVARDLAAMLRINYGHQGELRMPDISAFHISDSLSPIAVTISNPSACPRYSGVCIKDVQVGPSPDWLKNRLAAIGVRSINNVVDITNFVLHELGQPLHAFDYDAITNQHIIVQTLPQNTPFLALDGSTRNLHPEDLMICDGLEQGLCMGGVFGGLHSGVTDQTRHIFLESAHFNPGFIRRSSMRHNLRTDAAKIFEKGSDPNITVYALQRAALLICDIAGGKIASDIVDVYPNPLSPKEVSLRYDHISRLTGVDIPKHELFDILDALDMPRIHETAAGFTVQVPTNKADVLREADVIEEILRIYGFNKVAVPKQIRTAATQAPKPDPFKMKNAAADFLSAAGFHEMMALSLTESRYYKDFLPAFAEEELVFIQNTSNVNLDIMRPDMLFSALEATLHNQNRQQHVVKLFEFGKTYRRQAEQILEQNHLSLIIAGNRYPESWLEKDRQADMFTLKAFCVNILQRFGAGNYQESASANAALSPGVRYHRGEKTLAEIGKVSGSITKAMGIRGEVFFADIRWDALMESVAKQKIAFSELNKFPTVRRDLALIVENSVKFSDIAAIAGKTGKGLIKAVNLFDVYQHDQTLGVGKKSCAVSFLFEDPAKTLQDKDVEKIMDQLIQTYEAKLGALIRR